MNTGKIDLSDVRFFVLDEADRLVSDAADAAAILELYNKLPKAVHRLQVRSPLDAVKCLFFQTNRASVPKVLMFSATLHSPEITSTSEKICKFPTWVDLKGKESVPEVNPHA